jgi:DNA-binding response OmpR family regulator
MLQGQAMRVGFLEQDPLRLRHVKLWLSVAGHQVESFKEIEPLLATIERRGIEAFVFDWDCCPCDPSATIKQVRRDSHLPVLVLGTDGNEGKVISAFVAGADCYLVQPIRRLELIARLESVSRRVVRNNGTQQCVTLGNVLVDQASRRVMCDGALIRLAPKSFDLALLLLRNVNRLVTREQISETVWGRNVSLTARTIDTHIADVRKNLRLTPDKGWRLLTVYRRGYRLEQVPLVDKRNGCAEAIECSTDL